LTLEDPGYRPDDLYTVNVAPVSPSGPVPSPQQSLREYEAALEIAAGIPGIVAVAGGDAVISSGRTVYSFTSDDSIRGARYEVDAGHFAKLGTRLLAGREFGDAEVRARANVGLLNPAAVQAVWPGTRVADAVGRSLVLSGEPARTIVGIVPPMTRGTRGDETRDRPQLYVPLGTRPRFYSMFLARAEPGRDLPLELLRSRIAERLGPRRIAIASATTRLDGAITDPRFRTVLFAVFAICALLLAAAGLYALAAFDVATRRYEMSVRMSLGASRQQVHALVIGGTVRPVVLGLAIGGLAAAWLAGFLEAYLYKTAPRDPWAFASVAVVLTATAVLAAWIPARRAARVDPAAVLRAT
jgi:hypothetical protein